VLFSEIHEKKLYQANESGTNHLDHQVLETKEAKFLVKTFQKSTSTNFEKQRNLDLSKSLTIK